MGSPDAMALIPFHSFMLHLKVLMEDLLRGFGCCCPIRRLSDGKIQLGQDRGLSSQMVTAVTPSRAPHLASPLA